MSDKRQDLLVASCFSLFGLALVISAGYLPEGMGKLPGPGFFPAIIGYLMLVLAAGLGFQTARRKQETSSEANRIRQVAGAAALTFAYLLLWGSGLFAVRTAIFLAVLLRFLGQSWKASVAVAVTLTAAVTLAFQYGLRVSLE
jgi:hypothetical protein